MPELVQLNANEGDQKEIVGLLEETLERARRGEIKDIAIVAALHDSDGPQFWHGYSAEVAYGTLLAGVSALAFDLHYQRYMDAD